MHDEGAQHAYHFSHGHVRVLEICTLLMQRELIDETTTRRNRVLADS